MADFKSVNEGKIISDSSDMQNKLERIKASRLENEGNALLWDGSEAKQNLVNALINIGSETSELTSALNKCNNIGTKVQKYKEICKKIEELEQEKSRAKYKVNLKKSDPQNTSVPHSLATYQEQLHRVRTRINQLEEQKKTSGNALAAAGYSPQKY